MKKATRKYPVDFDLCFEAAADDHMWLSFMVRRNDGSWINTKEELAEAMKEIWPAVMDRCGEFDPEACGVDFEIVKPDEHGPGVAWVYTHAMLEDTIKMPSINKAKWTNDW